ncbi:hypothetical protein [Actinomyces oris]|uniref:Uncharacterized protein n=1 Tax=Actinomyces oris TaxID=544580 RepID=A0A1Q8WXH2_9ACTO|nr:hypothetical protein [Actinomyces oris]OLO72796.1 hypothetical protein BKH19_02050 [Actinomyces oris]QQC40171.1 hypothetical protein I6I08_02405 [Actinomyces oris]TQD61191.1 hypothetical protein FK267_06850 [Actinomyces oris]
MSRRILSVVVTVLGLVLVALAVCSATIWKPGSKVEAKLASGPSQPYVITAPGVLSGAESDVTVTASSSDGKDVHLFVARAADLDAWMSPDADNALPYTAITSIDADAGTLASKDETQYCPPANAAPAPSAAPSAQPSASAQAGGSKCSERKAKGVTASGSDIWLGEKTGGSSVTFDTGKDADRAMLPHKNLDEQIVVMAMTDGKASAPGLTVSWKRQVETPWYFYGGLVLGSVFVLVGAFLFFIDLQLRRANVDRRTRSAERAARIANADSVSTEGIPQVDDPDRRLTRRELRDKERAEASGEPWTDPRTGRVYLGGVEAPAASQMPEAVPAEGYDYGPAAGLSEVPGSGFGDGAAAYGEGHGGQGDHAVAGLARGASVVPGLDEAATQQYRAAREPEGLQAGEALTITSDATNVPDSSAYSNPPALSDVAGGAAGAGHMAVGVDPVADQPTGAPDHSRFAPPEHHTSHVASGSDARSFETDTAEFQDAASSVPPQDPGLQMPTELAQPEVSDASLSWSEQEVEPAHGPTFSPSGFGDSSATSTTVSWPSYSDGVELPPQADPAVIQAVDAEPLSEPDPTADPDNQERA